MKKQFALFLSTASLLHAGAPEVDATLAAKPEPWIKPIVDIRARYEFADTDMLETSHALTLRGRVGLKTAAWNGFSGLVEGEFTRFIVDDYHANAGSEADPYDPSNSVISDPETNELNQAYLQYAGFDTTFKVGRQRIIYDNAAFIGNVGWRQNEQTYDAFSIVNKSIDGLTLNYAYINQVNRIFGSDADSPLTATFGNVQDLSSDIHLFNASYAGIKGVTLGGYAYIMDFEDFDAFDNNTFGISAKGTVAGLTLYGELAFQEEAGPKGDDEAAYYHVTATKAFGPQSVTLGVEHLDAGFKTPLATVHAFNGFSDATDGARLNGSHNGLTNVYISHTIPIFCGIKWMNALHAFGDNEFSTGYGWEFDSVLTKKFNDNITALAKFAQFESNGDPYTGGSAGKALPTTQRVSVELDFTF